MAKDSCSAPGHIPKGETVGDAHSSRSGKHAGPGVKIAEDAGFAWTILVDSDSSPTAVGTSACYCDLVRAFFIGNGFPSSRRFDPRVKSSGKSISCLGRLAADSPSSGIFLGGLEHLRDRRADIRLRPRSLLLQGGNRSTRR